MVPFMMAFPNCRLEACPISFRHDDIALIMNQLKTTH